MCNNTTTNGNVSPLSAISGCQKVFIGQLNIFIFKDHGQKTCFTVQMRIVLYDILSYLNEFRESLIDEDEGDEEGKDLLGEGGDVAN